MATKRKYTFYIEEAQAAALRDIKARDGVLESEQIRRALDDWIAKKDVAPKGERKRPASRRRS